MSVYEQLDAQAERHEKQAQELRKQAAEARLAELRKKPLADRLIYAAYSRCSCGAGLAYDPCFEDATSVFVGCLSGCWDCSAILTGVADKAVTHTDKLPFAFYEILSEQQPSAHGATTRPQADCQ